MDPYALGYSHKTNSTHSFNNQYYPLAPHPYGDNICCYTCPPTLQDVYNNSDTKTIEITDAIQITKNTPGDALVISNDNTDTFSVTDAGFVTAQTINTQSLNTQSLTTQSLTTQSLTTQAVVTTTLNGVTVTTNILTVISDMHKKKNIHPIVNSDELLDNIHAVWFNWKTDTDSSRQIAGVLAQNVQAVMPGAVHTDSEGGLSVDYNQLIGLLLADNRRLSRLYEDMRANMTML
jgi:hypothetical protein